VLPNLPALAGDWVVAEIPAITVAGTWTQILPADPTRWAIGFCPPTSRRINVSTNPDTAGNAGIQLAGPLVAMYYKDFGPLVQSEWSAFDFGIGGFLWVFVAHIRKHGVVTADT
jgi:hypothetical protein